MGAFYNLSVRVIRRAWELPSRGFPMLTQSYHEPFDDDLGVNTSGVVLLTNVRSKNFTHGFRYEPCSPTQVRWAIDHSGVDPKEFSYIDIGCGKGRALIIASQYHFAELTGVDYSSKLCKIASANLHKLQIQARIVCQDAVQFQIPERDVFIFLFNPFDAVVLRKVLSNLQAAKRVVVVYAGPGRGVVEEQAWLQPFGSLRETALFRNF
jgi:SAM-dependent methyltransferase